MTSTDPQRLGGVAEISNLLDVPRTTVSMWDSRRVTSGFPEPIQRLQMGPIYNLNDVERWFLAKYPGEQLTIPEEQS